MICPNCGANNSTRATFCRRCHQRLPNTGLASGVTYPRRRNVAGGGGNRLPIYAAIAFAIVAFIIGALLVGLSRPGSPTGSFIAVVTPTPGSTLPTFSPEGPTPTPSPPVTPPPFVSFPPLPTPMPPTIAPETVTPTVGPTDVPVTPAPTPTPNRTPKPPRTPKPTPAPTPTPTPAAFSCAAATGTPTGAETIGTLKPSARTGNWCIERVTIEFFPPSTYGVVRLLLNGNRIAQYNCAYPDGCPTPFTRTYAVPRLALRGSTLRYQAVCQGNPDTPEDECTDPGVIATITIEYEPATRP